MAEKKQGTTPKQKIPFDWKRCAIASLPFMGMISFWQVFDGLVPKMLTQTFGLSNWLTGVVMALDNVFGLFLLPWFGILSDRCRSRLGRRTPSSWPALSWQPSPCRSSPWRTTWEACRCSSQ